MKKVIFVDDEKRILEGLRRLLRPMRKEWDMAFASGGDEALRTLARDTFDVIVSDMRMPGMDGAALLKTVMQRYPQLVRIVLSGQASEEAAIRSVGVAHQFLAKPCDAQKLKHTIDRAFSLRGVLGNESLTKVLSQTKTLPSMPALYVEINKELQHPNSSIRRVGQIIGKDPGMTAKILQLVNSAFFGLSRHVSSPVEAASLLGTETLRSLVLSVGIFSQFHDAGVTGFDLDTLSSHSTSTGALAKQIAMAEKTSRPAADDAMMAGVLHDIGKLPLVQDFPESYRKALTVTGEGNVSLCDAEREVFGATHADVGAYLLRLWGLPDSILEAVAFHHCPHRSSAAAFSPLTAVHAANVLEHEFCETGNSGNGATGIDRDYLAGLNLTDRVPLWQDMCRKLHGEETTT